MKAKPPIPHREWQRIVAFFQAGATGQIVLEVKRGQLREVSLNERLRVEEQDEAAPTPALRRAGGG